MGIRERQDRERQAVYQRHPRRGARPLRRRGVSQRLHPQDRRAHRIQPGGHLQLLSQQGRHLLRPRRGRLPPARREDPAGADDRRSARAGARRLVGLLRVLQGTARVLRADVRRPLGAADHRAVGQASRSSIRCSTRRRRIQRCIDAGVFPASQNAAAVDARPLGRADRSGGAGQRLPAGARGGPRCARARHARRSSPACRPACASRSHPCMPLVRP